MEKSAKVVQSKDGDTVPAEIIASSIVAISEGVKKLRAGRLNDRALVLLIHAACGTTSPYGKKPGTADVRLVLEAMQSLERTFLKPKEKKA